jgi:hypothetical protein
VLASYNLSLQLTNLIAAVLWTLSASHSTSSLKFVAELGR